jgi:hypothetical protein
VRVEFNVTIDDFVDIAMRLSARSKVIRTWRWQGRVLTFFLTWFVGFVVTSGSTITKLIVALVLAGAITILYVTTYRRSHAKRLRELYRERLEINGPIKVEVEVTETNIIVKQMGNQTTYEWRNVKSIEEREDSIDVFLRDGGGIAVRKRGFGSNQETEEFLRLCKNSVELSNGMSTQPPAS